MNFKSSLPTSMTKPKRTTRPHGSVKKLAESLGITTRRVSDLLREGMPDDPAAAKQWRAEHSGGSSAERLREERILLLQSQRRRIDLEHEVEAGRYLPAADVQASVIRIVGAARDAFLRMPHELPPRIEGLPAARIARVLHDEVVSILTELSNELTYADPAE